MKKKLLSLLLVGVMVAGVMTGCGASEKSSSKQSDEEISSKVQDVNDEKASEETEVEEEKYAEKISFSMTGHGTVAGVDYIGDSVGPYIMENFNVDFEILPNDWEGSKERFTIQAVSGELTDFNLWYDFNWEQYYEYVDQGLLAPLPDDWEERWPNMADMIEKSGVKERLEVDGKTYAIPHATFGLFFDVNPITAHRSLWIRSDFAKEVGMEGLGEDGTITLSELRAYLEKVQEAELVEYPVLCSDTEGMQLTFEWAHGIPHKNFVKDENGNWFWIQNNPNYIDAVKEFQSFYNDGLIWSDFYNYDITYFRELFYDNRAAAMMSNCAISFPATYIPQMTGWKKGDGMGNVTIAAIASEDGVVTAEESENFYSVHVFKPDIEMEKMERILDIVEWSCTKEGSTIVNVGLEGEDYVIDENGARQLLYEEDGTTQKYPEGQGYYLLGYVPDDFSADTSVMDDEKLLFHEYALKLYKTRAAGKVYPVTYELTNITSEPLADAYNTYNASVNIYERMVQMIVENEDIDEVLPAYVEEMQAYADSVLNELNNN